MPKRRRKVMVDAEGFVHVDGVKVARRVERDGEVCLQFIDKCKRRSSDRGSKVAEIPAKDFDRVVLNGPIASDIKPHID